MSTSVGVARIVVMGPSGCGKTTLASALAERLGLQFIEGDTLHPAANVARMSAGQPLRDADRLPWLDAVAARLADPQQRGMVVSCSALKRQYRDHLRSRAGALLFVHPLLTRELLAARLTVRTGHFMPAALLDSQLADLEPLAPDEAGLCIDGTEALESQLQRIRSQLGA